MKNLKITSNNIPFLLNIVEKGENYGLDNCLTHEKVDPLVEFYDQRYMHTPLGQFVSRYYMSTLLEKKDQHVGLDLDGGVPDWKVNAEQMKIVRDWLSHENTPFVAKKPKV